MSSLDRIEALVSEPPPTLPELDENPSETELVRAWFIMAKTYAGDALLLRQALKVMIAQLRVLSDKVEILEVTVKENGL